MRLIFILITAIIFFNPVFAQVNTTSSNDSTSSSFSKEDIAMILSIFDKNKVPDIISNVERLILTGRDSAQTASLAALAFDYYYSSNVMGHEEIALYLADNYFLNKKYEWPNEDGLLLLSMFAEYNRSSIIGLYAPELYLQDSLGNNISLLNTKGDFKVLFFYDDHCAACNKYIPLLAQFFNSQTQSDMLFYRVYTQDARDRWTRYIKIMNQRYPTPDNIKVVDVWDPELSSDFHKKYGVLSTPQLFLLDSNNTIIGRGLTPNALLQIVTMYQNQPSELEIFFDKIFPPLIPSDSNKQTDSTLITDAIDMLYEDSRDNPKFFHELFYELYQYLKTNPQYDLQKGAAYIGVKYITGKPKLWQGWTNMNYPSVDEFLKETIIATRRFYKNPLGKPVSDLSLTSIDKSAFSIYNSDTKHTVLYFYNMDCALCEAVTADMKTIHSEFGDKVNFLGIYTGKSRRAWKKYIEKHDLQWDNLWDKSKKSSEMFDKYDLSGVPAIYIIDQDKVGIAKDITPSLLKDILGYLYNETETQK